MRSKIRENLKLLYFRSKSICLVRHYGYYHFAVGGFEFVSLHAHKLEHKSTVRVCTYGDCTTGMQRLHNFWSLQIYLFGIHDVVRAQWVSCFARACNFTVNYLNGTVHIIFRFRLFRATNCEICIHCFWALTFVFGANFMPKMDLSDINVA